MFLLSKKPLQGIPLRSNVNLSWRPTATISCTRTFQDIGLTPVWSHHRHLLSHLDPANGWEGSRDHQKKNAVLF